MCSPDSKLRASEWEESSPGMDPGGRRDWQLVAHLRDGHWSHGHPFCAKGAPLAPKTPSRADGPGDSDEAEWIIGRRVARKALMARRAQSYREGIDCDEAPNG